MKKASLENPAKPFVWQVSWQVVGGN